MSKKNTTESPQVNVDEIVENETVEEMDDTESNPLVTELTQQLEALQGKAQENWDKFVAASAEVDNIRKRAERDVANAHKYGVEKFVKSLLPVLDSMEKSLETFEGHEHDVTVIKEGAELTLKMLLDAINKMGVERLDPEGEPFDPHNHEAMSMQPSDNVEPNTVIAVVQKGYVLQGRLLRPAMVIVSK